MIADKILTALQLPVSARVDRRVPKSLLVEHGAPTAADKRQITEGIEQLRWVAILKPATVGIPVYRDGDREYLEIAVVRATCRAGAKMTRLTELLHRAIPYPVLAVTEVPGDVYLSVAHKRWSQGQTGKTVLDAPPTIVHAPTVEASHWQPLVTALNLAQQPRSSMLSVYQGWCDVLLALEAARETGDFVLLASAERRAIRQEALRECARLDAEIAHLRAAAAKEQQMARLVELNAAIQRTETARTTARAQLRGTQ